jgi:hypothetical protein
VKKEKTVKRCSSAGERRRFLSALSLRRIRETFVTDLIATEPVTLLLAVNGGIGTMRETQGVGRFADGAKVMSDTPSRGSAPS